MTFINISTLTTEKTGVSANGSLLNGDGRTITWNAENKPVSIVKDGVTTTFVYDGDSRRVKQTVADGQTLRPFPSPLPFRLPYAYWKLITDNFPNLQYYLGGKQIALRKGGVLSYLHQDSLGSSSVTSNSAGAEVSRISYFPFGDCRNSTGTMPTDKLFTGQRLDSTGLYYYNARYYDPSIGRFISPDTVVPHPANPQSLNRYSYCYNNPLKYVDPSGHYSASAQYELLNIAWRFQNGSLHYWPDPNIYELGGTFVPSRHGDFSRAKKGAQEGLDVLGMVPVGGEFFDGLNALIYLLGGDYLNAGLSAFAAIPFLGWAATSGKWAKKGIGCTGKIGEESLKAFGGIPHKYFSVPGLGGRFVDRLVDGVAMESKVGRVSLTNSIQQQIDKDVALKVGGRVDSVEWHFFESPVTGKQGPTGPLKAALKVVGINIMGGK